MVPPVLPWDHYHEFFLEPELSTGLGQGRSANTSDPWPPGQSPRCIFGDPERWNRDDKCWSSGDGGLCCGGGAGVSRGQLCLRQISGSFLLRDARIGNRRSEMRSLSFPELKVCAINCLVFPHSFFHIGGDFFPSVLPFLRLDAYIQLKNPFFNKKASINVNHASVRFTFTLIRHISRRWAFLLGLFIRVFCTAKEISPVLFSGSMNSRMYLWVFQFWWHQHGNARKGTRQQQAAFLPLLIYCISEN